MTAEKKTTLSVARTQIGIREATGKNDGIPAERYMMGDMLPWCAGFILWCNAESDDPKIAQRTADRWNLRSVLAMQNAMAARGLLRAPSEGLPQPNELVFYSDRGSSDVSAAGRHVGIVERLENGVLTTIEGNVGNKVARLSTPWASAVKRITAFAKIG